MEAHVSLIIWWLLFANDRFHVQIKFQSVKLARKYLERVSSELESIKVGPDEEELMLQGVRFAFRVHQVGVHTFFASWEIVRTNLTEFKHVVSCSLQVVSTLTLCARSKSSKRRLQCAIFSGKGRIDICDSKYLLPGPEHPLCHEETMCHLVLWCNIHHVLATPEGVL
jgi:hypothetical protein